MVQWEVICITAVVAGRCSIPGQLYGNTGRSAMVEPAIIIAIMIGLRVLMVIWGSTLK